MKLELKNVEDQRICVITGKYLPTYAHVRVDQDSGQIGLLFDARPRPESGREPCGCDVVSSHSDLNSLASLHWYSSELLNRIYEVKPTDLEFGLGCPLAVKEDDLAEFRQFVCNYTPSAEISPRPC